MLLLFVPQAKTKTNSLQYLSDYLTNTHCALGENSLLSHVNYIP